MKRVERVEDADVRGFCAQGIVGAGGIIPTSTASCRRAGSRRITTRWIRPKYAALLPAGAGPPDSSFAASLSPASEAPSTGRLDLAGQSRPADRVAWRAFVDALFDTDWVVYAKPAFGGAAAVLRYLGQYTHRVAISNHRLLVFTDDRCRFGGRITGTGVRFGRSRSTSTSFSAASCSTSYRNTSSASASLAFSPTAVGPRG